MQRDKGEDRGGEEQRFLYPLSPLLFQLPLVPRFFTFSLLFIFIFSFIYIYFSPFWRFGYFHVCSRERPQIYRSKGKERVPRITSWSVPILRWFKCHVVRDKKREERKRKEEGGGKRRVSWGPVSIYVNYRGGRKSRSPRCSVGKVGKGCWPSPNRHGPAG